MLLGVGRVIFWYEVEGGIPPSYAEKLERLDGIIRNAFEIIDIDKFNNCVDEIFSIPKPILGSPEARSWIKRIKSDFFIINNELLKTFADPETLRKRGRLFVYDVLYS